MSDYEPFDHIHTIWTVPCGCVVLFGVFAAIVGISSSIDEWMNPPPVPPVPTTTQNAENFLHILSAPQRKEPKSNVPHKHVEEVFVDPKTVKGVKDENHLIVTSPITIPEEELKKASKYGWSCNDEATRKQNSNYRKYECKR